MKNDRKIEVCYNEELSVDAKEHAIVNYDVTDEANEEKQTIPGKGDRDVLGIERLEVTVDSVFANMIQIRDCLDNG